MTLEGLIRGKLSALDKKNEALWRDFKECNTSDRDETCYLIATIKENEVKIELLEEIIYTYETYKAREYNKDKQ